MYLLSPIGKRSRLLNKKKIELLENSSFMANAPLLSSTSKPQWRDATEELIVPSFERVNSMYYGVESFSPTLVDFYATWCGPCKTMSPILEDFKNKMGDKVKVIKIDVDKNPKAASAYQVRGVPTLVLFKGGQIKWRQSGVVMAQDLIKIVNQHA